MGSGASPEVHCRVTPSVGRPRPQPPRTPYAQWSLSRLREEAVQRGLVPSISEEWWRAILHEVEVSHQSIRTWKTSPDPLFEYKNRKVIRLIRNRHNSLVVPLADGVGPIQLIPQCGEGWIPHQRTARKLAEYHCKFGTVYDFLTLNGFHQWLFRRVYRMEHAANWLGYLKDVRAEHPRDQWVNQILGCREQPLEGGHSSLGESDQGATVFHAHSGESAEAGEVPRRGPPEAGPGRGDLHDPPGRGPGARLGGPLSQ